MEHSELSAASKADGTEADANARPPQPRTPGLKAFDVLLYPIFTNIAVFGISVAATYLTSRGAERTAQGALRYGKIGEWFQSRGEKLVKTFKSMGMGEQAADMSKMVFFSFVDGSLMAPFVKLFEDRRERIGRALDEAMGTKPADESVYAAEPKQTWLSVLGGRFVTASIVVPTAVLLQKTGHNDTLFNKPGEQVGKWLEKQPIAKQFGSLDVKELTRISFFEAFYTSVCTAGLYLSSRCIARITGDKKHREMHGIPSLPGITRDDAADDTPKAPATEQPAPIVLHAKDSLKKPGMPAPATSYAAKYETQSAVQPALAL